MEYIAVGLPVCIAACLGYVAYTYPKTYRPVYATMMSLATMALIAGVAWDTASYFTFKETLPFIRDIYVADAFGSADRLRFGYFRLGVGYLVMVMFLTILRLLHTVVPYERKPELSLIALAGERLKRSPSTSAAKIRLTAKASKESRNGQVRH